MHRLARLACSSLLVAGTSRAGSTPPPAAPDLPPAAGAPVRTEAVEAKWGVAAVSLRPTMDGRMLDFRYKVLDATKALPVFDRKLKPYLFDPAARAALGMPEDSKLGALRASLRNPPVAGKQYYILFANSLGKVTRGSKVSVVIGDCRFDGLTVE